MEVVMNLFSEIEGLRGENLTTAILRVLLLRSQDLRERFIRLVSDNCRLGPLTLGEHFSCLVNAKRRMKRSGVGGWTSGNGEVACVSLSTWEITQHHLDYCVRTCS